MITLIVMIVRLYMVAFSSLDMLNSGIECLVIAAIIEGFLEGFTFLMLHTGRSKL